MTMESIPCLDGRTYAFTSTSNNCRGFPFFWTNPTDVVGCLQLISHYKLLYIIIHVKIVAFIPTCNPESVDIHRLFFGDIYIYINYIYGWWFGTFFFPYTLGIITPTDFHIFQRGRYTSNQMYLPCLWIPVPVPREKKDKTKTHARPSNSRKPSRWDIGTWYIIYI